MRNLLDRNVARISALGALVVLGAATAAIVGPSDAVLAGPYGPELIGLSPSVSGGYILDTQSITAGFDEGLLPVTVNGGSVQVDVGGLMQATNISMVGTSAFQVTPATRWDKGIVRLTINGNLKDVFNLPCAGYVSTWAAW